ADMRSFDLGRRFHLVTIPFRPLQHLNTVSEQVSCLTSVRRHLEPNGLLVLDVYNPDIRLLARPGGEEDEPEPPFTMPDGRVVTRSYRTTRLDEVLQVAHGELLFDVRYPDGRTERLVEPLMMRYFFRYELEHLL